MNEASHRVLYLLWTVIVVLVVGGAIVVVMLVRKADNLAAQNATLSTDNDALHRQLQRRTTPSPSVSPSPTLSPSPSASGSPKP